MALILYLFVAINIKVANVNSKPDINAHTGKISNNEDIFSRYNLTVFFSLAKQPRQKKMYKKNM